MQTLYSYWGKDLGVKMNIYMEKPHLSESDIDKFPECLKGLPFILNNLSK